MNLFSERLRSLRKASGIKQSDLAKTLGVTEKSLRNYEKGDFEPSITQLIMIADIFGVTVDYLIGRDDNKDNSMHHIPHAAGGEDI